MERRPTGRRERALGERLFLKGARSLGPKAAMVRRPYPPGIQGKSKRRRMPSEYAQQLRNKQKFRVSYGLTEKQLKRLVREAMRQSGVTGPKIVELLERRLDNVIYRLGFGPSRMATRQLIVQGHIMVNKRKVTSPSCLARVNDTISIRPESRNKKMFTDLGETVKKTLVPPWLHVDQGTLEGKVVALPTNVEPPFDINAVVEFYSK
ncbi:MAG: 30S ribosomal protein S4 [bacterium]|nr:30S ribosomal protein S4 [bacterium]